MTVAPRAYASRVAVQKYRKIVDSRIVFFIIFVSIFYTYTFLTNIIYFIILCARLVEHWFSRLRRNFPSSKCSAAESSAGQTNDDGEYNKIYYIIRIDALLMCVRRKHLDIFRCLVWNLLPAPLEKCSAFCINCSICIELCRIHLDLRTI